VVRGGARSAVGGSSRALFSAGGGRRRSVGSVAGDFTKRKHIPKNTPWARVGQAGRRREAAAQEGVGWRSEDGRGRSVGPGGVSLAWPVGQGPGRGQGEWAGQGGRRGGPRLGQIRSRAIIQKEFLFKFQLILEYGKTLENCTRIFRRKFDMKIFPEIF
jgi:hypothetical protein